MNWTPKITTSYNIQPQNPYLPYHNNQAMTSGGPVRLTLLASTVAFILALRFPYVQGPTGIDSFQYLAYVQAINEFGKVAWLNKLAAFWGLWPTTTPTGGLLVLATYTQTTGLSEISAAFLLPLAYSLLGSFGAFMWVGTLSRARTARFGAALLFACLPRLLFATEWTYSIRFLFACALPLWLYLVSAMLVAGKANRHPARYIALAIAWGILLPAFHRMGLTLPLLILAAVIALGVGMWQKRALAPYWFGRTAGMIFVLLVFYILAVSILDPESTPYSPDSFIFSQYLFDSGTPFATALNLGIFYMLMVGPPLLLAVFGMTGLFSEGRLEGGHWLALLTVAIFVPLTQDETYLNYIVGTLVVGLAALGLASISRDLDWRPLPRVVVIAGLVLVSGAFANTMVMDSQDHHDSLTYGYTRQLQPDLEDAIYYIEHETPAKSVITVNDRTFRKRIISHSDSIVVSSNLVMGEGYLRGDIDPDSYELRYTGWNTLFFEQKDHLWEIASENSNQSFYSSIAKNRSLSMINNNFPAFAGKASIPETLKTSNHYLWLGQFNYAILTNELTTLYYSYGYDRGGGIV